MKPILYYTLSRRRMSRTCNAVIGVTSEKPNTLYGRWLPSNCPTNIKKEKCIGRFDSVAAADKEICRLHAELKQ